MLRNYLKIALRSFRRQPVYAFINIGGLAAGLTVCLLIGVFVYHEFSYDRFHEDADRIYRVLSEYRSDTETSTNALTPEPLSAALDSSFAGIDHSVRIDKETGIVRRKDDRFREDLLFVDSDFFQVFSFRLESGAPGQVLNDPNSIVLSPKAARRYFGSENPVGETLAIDFKGNVVNCTVTGVTEEIPTNSSITYDVLLSRSTLASMGPRYTRESWYGASSVLYIKTTSPQTAETITEQLPSFIQREVPANIADRVGFRLQPLTDVHFDSGFYGSTTAGSLGTYSLILLGIALLVLFIACSNFTTLAIGRSASRGGEVGIRKTLGAHRRQLIGQFWGEAVLTTAIAGIAALLLARLSLPVFGELVDRQLPANLLTHPYTLGGMLVLISIVALAAGSYPAFHLSRFQPSRVLRGLSPGGDKHRVIRGLIVGQFALSIVLIIGVLLTDRQMELVQSRELGFDEEQVVRLDVVKYREGPRLLDRYQTALNDEPRIRSVSGSWNLLGGGEGVSFSQRQVKIESDEIRAFTFGVAPNFPETLNLHLVAGRDFSSDGSGVLVNEAFVRAAGWDDPLGRTISLRDRQPIIGVVEDFHFQSLHHQIRPLVMHLGSPLTALYARIAPGNPDTAINTLEESWTEVAPDQPFNYTFLDRRIEQQYETEQRWASIISWAAAFAIGIACMGLFGLAMLSANRRTKEIGIRKVLGASVPRIVALLSRDFLKLVAISFVLAVPLAYFGARRWLQNFAYHVDLSPVIFLLGGLTALAIALLTVSYQSIKAALTNPSDSLRYE
jgi:putative ABC transport system permease protein